MTPENGAIVLDPILRRDPVLAALPEGSILTLDFLRTQTGFPDQKIRSLYATELLHQVNILLKLGYDRNQVGKLVGYTPDAISKLRIRYNLSREFDEDPIMLADLEQFKVDELAKKAEENTQWIRTVYKVQILHEINVLLLAGKDIKNAGKEIDLKPDVSRKLVKQYKLPDTSSIEQNVVEAYTGKPVQITESQVEYSPANERTVQVGSNTRLITSRGEVLYASELVGKNSTELKEQGPFLSFNHKNEIVSSDILRASKTKGDAYRFETMLGVDVKLGTQTKVIGDWETGLIPTAIERLNDKAQVLSANHFRQLPSFSYTFFDLLAPTTNNQTPIYFVLKKEVGDEIVHRLTLKHKTLKKACNKLEIKYRKIADHQDRLFARDFLIKIYNDIGYPDITLDDFIGMVERIGIGGEKAIIKDIKIEKDLLYIAGLVASDGWVSSDEKRKSVIGFSNTVIELLNEFANILKKYFPEKLVSFKHPKNPKYTAIEANTYNYPVVQMLNNLGIKGKDVTDKYAYLPLLKLSQKNIVGFLQGLFDGDGNVDLHAQKIQIAVFDPDRVKNTQLLVKKIGINSKIKKSKQLTRPPYSKNNILSHQYSIEISGKNDLLKFIAFVGSRHPKKKGQMKQLVQQLNTQKSSTSKYDYAPKACGKLIRSIRDKMDLSQSDLKQEYNVWKLEATRYRTSISNVDAMIKEFEQYSGIQDIPEYHELRNMISFYYNTDKLRSIKKLQNIDLIEIKVNNRILVDTGLVIL